MAESLHVAVRTFHVLGMTVLLGGAGALWYAARRGDDQRGDAERANGRRDDGIVGSFGAQYEWVFWGVLGVMVVTGIGNLGALGAPGPDTRWGTILTMKLLLVVAFVLGSLVRTAAVVQMDAGDRRHAASFRRRAYGATTGALLALVVLAEVLAHG